MNVELDPMQLEALLNVLRDAGVKRFGCPAFKVEFSEAALSASISSGASTNADLPTAREYAEGKQLKPKTMWDDPTLWPGGTPPSFSGK